MANKELQEELVNALRTVTLNYETVLRMLHKSAHTQPHQEHCSIVACWEGNSVISRARTLLERAEKE